MSVRVGIAGVGRMGRRHAENLATRVPGASLVAAFRSCTQPSMIQRTATFTPPSSQGLEQTSCGMNAQSGTEPTRPSVWCSTAAGP